MVKKYPKKQGLESRINAFYFPVRCFDGFSYASFWKYGLFTGESSLLKCSTVACSMVNGNYTI